MALLTSLRPYLNVHAVCDQEENCVVLIEFGIFGVGDFCNEKSVFFLTMGNFFFSVRCSEPFLRRCLVKVLLQALLNWYSIGGLQQAANMSSVVRVPPFCTW